MLGVCRLAAAGTVSKAVLLGKQGSAAELFAVGFTGCGDAELN